ncbi:hypothetical protein ACFRQM_09465 [Streptomyces sp. NPDC056831]|uniref:hypothetical protein n=1 Tax=Streptomyces sp. NPDC056831 TaxID=3345954 RepID=UPI00369ECB21
MKWLRGGNDRELAATQYSTRESAFARKERVERKATRARRARGVARAAKAGEAWEDSVRAGGGNRWGG